MTLFHALVPDPGGCGPVDWPLIGEAFDWFRRLKDCRQDPVFHAEGDVDIHTRMVVEALLGDPAWRALERGARESLFWAALLHDVAKPATTRLEPNGRVIAPGHSRRGQIMARLILMRLGVEFRQREEICHLITHHQVPFFLIDRERPERRAHLISHQTRCDLLAILASAHSRFLYFRREDRAADYEAFDDWEGEATLLSGLPGAGKDTWLTGNAAGRAVISLDDLREERDVDPAGPQGVVIAAAKEQARVLLRAHRPFIWNATNVSHQLRSQLIDLFAAYRAKVRIVYLEAPEDEAGRRNRARVNPVPAGAIARMRDRWEPPDLTECHRLDVVLT